MTDAPLPSELIDDLRVVKDWWEEDASWGDHLSIRVTPPAVAAVHRLLELVPRVIQPGDRVEWDGAEWEVLAVTDSLAWLKGAHDAYETASLCAITLPARPYQEDQT